MANASNMAGFAAGRLDRITEHLTRHYIQPGKIAGCQTLVARGGEIAYLSSLGHADRERGKPMAPDTIFRIYSMTKPITSVALMMLFERGMFQLNDPVRRVLPEWSDLRVWVAGEGARMETTAPRRPILFRDLLTHTAGLTYGQELSSVGAPEVSHPVEVAYSQAKVARGRGETLASFIAKLGTVPLRYQPGERFMYSLATDVCGALVERLSGQRFDRFLQENIFDPLGMKDTGFHVPGEKLARFAACYERGADASLQLADDPQQSRFLREPSFLSGGGGLTSTTQDYFRFCEMLRRGGQLNSARLLGPRTIELMRMNHLPGGKDLAQVAIDSFSETLNDGVGFGLGFASTLDQVVAGSPSRGEYYWGGAASTIFWIDPYQDLVVIFMTQLMPSRTFNFRGQLKNIIYSALI
jgi:CubicO group peptidase (beta-lactamase class C family)